MSFLNIQSAEKLDLTINNFIPYSLEKPYNDGYLKVSEIHQIYYAMYGNPKGIPVVILHGGPGTGCSDEYTKFFDLNDWHVIMLDQRGVNRSIPFACMDENRAEHLVVDIEALRIHLEVDKFVVFGNSWGSCLALLYGEAYPDSCFGFILEGTFLGRDKDISFFRNMGKKSRGAYTEFLTNIPIEEQEDIPKACYKRIMSDDPEIHMKMANALMRYQLQNTQNPPSPELISKALEDEHFSLGFIRTFVHYAINKCFLKENQVLANINNISHLPCIIVHGSLDTICPLEQGILLHDNWPQSELFVVPNAGHSCKEDLIQEALIEASKSFILKIQKS